MRHGGCVWNTGNPYEWIDFSANIRPDGPPLWIEEAIHDAQKNIRFDLDSEMKRARRGLARFQDLPEEGVLLVAGGIAAMELLLSHGILVRSCASFGLPDSYWRLAVRTEEDNSRLINELEEILHVR